MKKVILIIAIAIAAATAANAQVGVNTETPKTTLDIVQQDTAHVKGQGFRLIDGNQRDGYVLTTNADGKATWKEAVIPTYYGNFQDEAGRTVYKADLFPNFKPTKAYIDLPPGAWKVDITLVLYMAHSIKQDSVKLWFQTTFASDTTFSGLNPLANWSEIGRADTLATYRLASATVSESEFTSCKYSTLSGTVIVRNNTSAVRRYFLIYSAMISLGHQDLAYPVIISFAMGAAENAITAIPINL